ncbi:hypothetical protein PALI_a2610 [Pseudoalteromonas aliena SW19]|jgi:hypothetical protein|uniref:Uncharacterized protein n=1 Tax=Pseudoalteromonas aliena SW19 TaxID=1314866 RepID=A0ABR9E219_9GAMM|nr:hypothetical protein [Pseudoalteromonas aliena SW19]
MLTPLQSACNYSKELRGKSTYEESSKIACGLLTAVLAVISSPL